VKKTFNWKKRIRFNNKTFKLKNKKIKWKKQISRFKKMINYREKKRKKKSLLIEMIFNKKIMMQLKINLIIRQQKKRI